MRGPDRSGLTCAPCAIFGIVQVNPEGIIMNHRGPNPSSLCLCGCGRKTSLATRTREEFGHVKGQPVNFIQNHRLTGERSFNWQGGRVAGHGIYVRVRTENHYEHEHRLLAEKALGKPLPQKAHVHHHTLDQLVICQDAAYHRLLHRRQKALKACGHTTWGKCWVCQKWSPPEDLKYPGKSRSPYHSSCITEYQKKSQLKRPLDVVV